MDYDIMECIDIFLNKIFEKSNVEEYKWIKENRIVLYCMLNIDNYRYTGDNSKIQEYMYTNKNSVLNIMIPLGIDNKTCRILEQIYSKKNFSEWWSLLYSIIYSYNEFNLSEGVMNIIIENKNIDEIFKKFEQNLYMYITSYGKQNKTDTFNYMNFRDYVVEVKTLLFLIKNKKIIGDKADDLVNRCKKILSLDYSDKNISNNYWQIYNSLKNDSNLFTWLNTSGI